MHKDVEKTKPARPKNSRSKAVVTVPFLSHGYVGGVDAGATVNSRPLLEHEYRIGRLTQYWASVHAPVIRIQAALKLATDVFGSEKVAEEWLTSPNLATNDTPPLALLGTDAGNNRVRDLLLRIDYGVLS